MPLILLLMACGSDPPAAAVTHTPTETVFGPTADTAAPLAPTADTAPQPLHIVGIGPPGGPPQERPGLTLTHGPAGGWHIEPSIHVAGLPPDTPEAALSVEGHVALPEGSRFDGSLRLLVATDPDGAAIVEGARFFLYPGDGLDWTGTACALAGTTPWIDLTVARLDDDLSPIETAEARLAMQVEQDPIDVEICASL